MSQTQATTTDLSLAERVACEIASGARAPDPSTNALDIRAAHRNLNAKGNGVEWHRMVYRDGAWRYFGKGRMPSAKILASDRKVTIRGDAYEGEILCQHPRGAQVDTMYLAIDGVSDDGKRGYVLEISFERTRDGLRAILPTGAHVTLPDPRREH